MLYIICNKVENVMISVENITMKILWCFFNLEYDVFYGLIEFWKQFNLYTNQVLEARDPNKQREYISILLAS